MSEMQWCDGTADGSSIWSEGTEIVAVAEWKGESTTKGVGELGCS